SLGGQLYSSGGASPALFAPVSSFSGPTLDLCQPALREAQGPALRVGYFFLPPARLWATAARRRSCKAAASRSAPAYRSMAREAFASRPALKRPCGSASAAPLK